MTGVNKQIVVRFATPDEIVHGEDERAYGKGMGLDPDIAK